MQVCPEGSCASLQAEQNMALAFVQAFMAEEIFVAPFLVQRCW